MRVIVSGGGTAGHISPILATVDALKSLDSSAEFLYVGSGRGLEAKLVSAAGLKFVGISAGKYRRFHGLKLHHQFLNLSRITSNAADIVRVLKGIWQSARIIRNFNPDVVFIKGGYVGLPAGIAAGLMSYPMVIHESDVLPGLTNRILARWARKIAVGFPADKYKDWYPDKLVFTGNPVRQIVLKAHRLEGVAAFELDAKLPVVLVMGGSQGARKVNDAVVSALPRLLESAQVIQVAGERDIERVKFETRDLRPELSARYRLAAFLEEEIGKALEVADIVISRAGANAIAELALLKKPAVLVPNPHLVGGHQTLNANVLSRSGAVRVITEDRLSGEMLFGEVRRLLEDEKEREFLAKKIGEFGVPSADLKLAHLIAESARKDEDGQPSG